MYLDNILDLDKIFIFFISLTSIVYENLLTSNSNKLELDTD